MDWTLKVLGPVQVVTSDGIASIGGQRSRALVAALVIGVGHCLSQDYLIEAIWGPEAAPHANAALQTQVSKLRHLLGPVAIITEEHSYRLIADCEQIDAVSSSEGCIRRSHNSRSILERPER